MWINTLSRRWYKPSITGDIHAITSVNNLIVALIDNELYQHSELNFDPDRIVLPRNMDMNDRSLTNIIVARNDSKTKDYHTSFCITVASEVMAIFCLSKNEEDFLNRVEDITVAYSLDNKLIFDKDLNCRNAIRFLIKDDLKPNLVQTKYRTPTFVHGGPFANIAHGTNFLIANDLTLKQADYVVTDDDFCSDLGMQKDLDVVSPLAELHPTIRALKLHVEMKFDELDKENIEAVKEGSKNLIKHLKNDRLYDIPVIVSINKFKSDTTNEIKALESILKEEGFQYALNTSYVDGTKGGKVLAAIALDEIDMNNKIDFKPLVNKKMILEEKIFVIANKIYGAGKVEYSSRAKKN